MIEAYSKIDFTIENELGEIKYETANAFDNVDQDEVLAYYLDDFI